MSKLVTDLIAALTEALPKGYGPVALHEPEFAGQENRYVQDCIETGWVSSVGKYVDRFEQDLAAYTGAPRAVAVVNGTAALHVCLLLAGVEPEDEVLCPTLSFIATANAIAYAQAIPHFIDSDETTLGLDPRRLEGYLSEIADLEGGLCRNRQTGRIIRAVVPMHTFGHPVDLDGLQWVCDRFGLVMVEDAAESLGSTYKGRHTGRFGRVAAISFNGNKIITTGGGGAILTEDPDLAQRAKHLTTTAKVPHRWSFSHDQTGFNYRLPNLNAALGCAQLEQLPRFIEEKRTLAAAYARACAGLSGLRFFTEPAFARSNYWLNLVLLDKDRTALRDPILEATNQSRLMTRPAWDLLHHQPMYRQCPRQPDLGTAESLAARIINIPSSAKLGRHSFTPSS